MAEQIEDLIDEPVSAMVDEDLIPRLDVIEVSLATNQYQPDAGSIDPQVEQRIFQFSSKSQWPEGISGGVDLLQRGGGPRHGGDLEGELGGALFRFVVGGYCRGLPHTIFFGDLDGPEGDPLALTAAGSIRFDLIEVLLQLLIEF